MFFLSVATLPDQDISGAESHGGAYSSDASAAAEVEDIASDTPWHLSIKDSTPSYHSNWFYYTDCVQ